MKKDEICKNCGKERFLHYKGNCFYQDDYGTLRNCKEFIPKENEQEKI